MKKERNYLFILSVLFLLGHFCSIPVFAVDSEDAVKQTGYYYEVVHPENQISDTGYFDLRMEAGQKQQVVIKIINTETEPIELNVRLNTAKTGTNGVLEYGPSSMEEDLSLELKFTDIVQAPETIEIPGSSEKDLILDIQMPEKEYAGVIAGGIQLQLKEEEGADSEQTGAIVNKFAYLIGMLLTESDIKLEPELVFRKVYAGHNNYRNSVFVEFSNVAAAFVGKMDVEVSVKKKNSDTVLYNEKKKDYRMAPNSLIKFPISMDGKAMQAGEYQAEILVSTKKESWEWTENFTITKEEAKKFNEETVDELEEAAFDWKLLLIIVLSAAFAVLLLSLIISRNKRKKMDQYRNRRMKKAKNRKKNSKNRKAKSSRN